MSDEIEIELHSAAPPPPPVTSETEGLVVVASGTLRQMDAHVAEDTSVEHGGVMVGHVDEATGATVVTGSIRAVGSVSEIASLTFTHETWDHIGEVMEAEFPDQLMVGWYHSHPHFGIFLSDHDQFIHRNFFGQPWQVAYVRDPLLDQRGFFSWVGQQLVEVEDWQEIDLPAAAPPPASGVDFAAPVPVDAPPPSDDPVVTVATPPTRAKPEPEKGRRLGPMLGSIVALVVIILAIVVASRLLGGEDEPEVQLEYEPASAPVYTPGDTTEIGTVRVVGELDEDVRLRLSAKRGIEQGGRRRIDVSPLQVEPGVWVLVASIPEDVAPGTYDGEATARICPEEDRCSGDDVERSEPVSFQFTVPAVEGEAPDDTTATTATTETSVATTSPTLAPEDTESEG